MHGRCGRFNLIGVWSLHLMIINCCVVVAFNDHKLIVEWSSQSLSRGRCRNRQSSLESSPRSRRARCRASYIPHIAGYHSIRDAPLWTASGHCGESGRGRVAVNCQIDGSIRSARSLRLSGRCRSRSRSKYRRGRLSNRRRIDRGQRGRCACRVAAGRAAGRSRWI